MSDVLGAPETAPARKSKWKKRTALGAVGAILVCGLAAGAFGARWYFHTGAQPAEALPANTLGYLALDLDPKGQQKLAARSILNSLPISDDEDLGSVGDFRRYIADHILEASTCAGIDFEHDVSPWLGNRAAVAFVPIGKAGPQPAVVLQSTDDGDAARGMKTLAKCGGSDFGGWHVHDGWIVVAPQQKAADAIAEAASTNALADSSDYRAAVEAAGGVGIVTGYASLKDLVGLIPQFATGADAIPPKMLSSFTKSLGGMALSARADGETIRVDAATRVNGIDGRGSATVDRLLASMPSDSSAAAAFDLTSLVGYPGMPSAKSSILQAFRAGMAEAAGPGGARAGENFYVRLLGSPLEKVLSDLLDSSAAVVLGKTAATMPSSPDELPLAAELVPDPSSLSRVQGYYRKLDRQFHLHGMGAPTKDGLVFASNPKSRVLLDHGSGLARSSRFMSVVHLEGRHPLSVLYVDLRSGLVKTALGQALGGEDPKWLANVSHLDAVGMLTWAENGYSKAELRIAVD